MDMDDDLEIEMKISRRELRVLLLHEFGLVRKVTEATSNICGTMGKNALSIRTAQHWFNRFKNGNFELNDLLHSGRSLPRSIRSARKRRYTDTKPQLHGYLTFFVARYQ